MQSAHKFDVCDYRDFKSSEFCDYRDGIFRANRKYMKMITKRGEVRDWLASQLERRGRGSKGKLAEFLGVRNDSITRILNDRPGKESREVKAEELIKMGEFFGEPPPGIDAVGKSEVPLVGYVGAGGEISDDVDNGEHLATVSVPFHVPGDMVAFSVKGTSMLPRYDEGDVIIVWREQRRDKLAFLGEEAAVRTNDGRRLLKQILRGNPFTLHSWNDRPIENVDLEWIGEIYATIRASQFRRAAAKK